MGRNPVRVRSAGCASSSICRATPKSSSFTVPSAFTNMFDGFQVAMHDRAAMGVLHGFAHGTEQAKDFVDQTIALPTVLRYGHAFDIFHREPGRSVRQRIRI